MRCHCPLFCLHHVRLKAWQRVSTTQMAGTRLKTSTAPTTRTKNGGCVLAPSSLSPKPKEWGVRPCTHFGIVDSFRSRLLCDRPARRRALRDSAFFSATCTCLARLPARLAVTRHAVPYVELVLASQVWPALSIHTIPSFLLVNMKRDFNYDFIREALE